MSRFAALRAIATSAGVDGPGTYLPKVIEKIPRDQLHLPNAASVSDQSEPNNTEQKSIIEWNKTPPPVVAQENVRGGIEIGAGEDLQNPQVSNKVATAQKALARVNEVQKEIWSNAHLWSSLPNVDDFKERSSQQIQQLTNGLTSPDLSGVFADLNQSVQEKANRIELRLKQLGVDPAEAGHCKELFLTVDPLSGFAKNLPQDSAGLKQQLSLMTPDSRRLALQAWVSKETAKALEPVVGRENSARIETILHQLSFEVDRSLGQVAATIAVRREFPAQTPHFITNDAVNQMWGKK